MILIFGGTGFVGSHVAEYLLDKGFDVTLASRNLRGTKNIEHLKHKIKLEQIDVTDNIQISKVIERVRPDVIYHLAGQLTTYESFEKPLYDVDANVKSTLSMLEAIKGLGKCRLILGSTFWVVGKPESLPINEESKCNPLNVYAANRLASEHICKIYNKVFDLDTVIMRLTNTFGPREQFDNKKKAAINFLIKKAIDEGEVTIYDNGMFFRDVTYISDVVSAAYSIQTRGQAGNIYFIGTGKRTWFHDLGRWIADYTGARVRYIESPDYHKRINVGNIIIDNTKLKSLGWDWKVEVKDGIKMTTEYYLNEVKEKIAEQ